MSRQSFVWRNGELVDRRFAAPLHAARSAPSVISDTMSDAALHPCTGKMMDSKSAFRRVTRENGCVEIGNETAAPSRAYETSHHEIESAIARRWRD